MSAELRPAATVALARDGGDGLETLLLCRSRKADFIANAWVFPGGGVDAADVAAEEDDVRSESAARNAAVRETREETGLIVPAEALTTIAHWTAPKESPRRYATWFFFAAAPGDDAVTVDEQEITGHRWYAPREALLARERGEIYFLPPTYVTLLWLSAWKDVASARAHFEARAPQHFAPRLAFTDDAACSVYQEDAAYEDGQLERPGPRHRFWMGEEWKYEADF